MGSDNSLIIKKCGYILVNMKKKNKKSKTYTFHCTFCETTWDQMKKFSLHLEKFHLQIFDEESTETDIIYEPEIKIESKIDNNTNNKAKLVAVIKDDPLNTENIGGMSPCDNNIFEAQIKDENENLDDNETDEMSFDYCYVTDDNLNKNEKKSPEKLKQTNKIIEQLDIDSKEKNLNIALLQLFEEKPYLWNAKEKCKNEIICQKGYETIANEINAKFATNISWDFVKNRINAMRFECSYEIEKQQNGKEFQLPWYFEHMKYLKQNIDILIKDRIKKKRFRSIDESNLLIFIELYKKFEDLWQVNNIFFGITAKRDEIFNRMLEELKSNYNIEITVDRLKDYIKYINRLYSKDKERELKSELNKYDNSTFSKYYEKLSFLNDSQGPFKCPHCNEIIQRFENYHIHVADHTKTRPFKCPLCELSFKKFHIYISHAKRHLSENSYRCDICGKGYPMKSELDRHLTFHTGEKQYLCQICGAGFRSSRDYDNHVRRHEKRFRYECHICKQGFNHLHILNDHVKSHLNVRDILCNICGKGFTATRYLNNHKLIHEEKKHYKCHVCGKEFAQGAGLRAHRKLHKPNLIETATKEKRQKEEYIPY